MKNIHVWLARVLMCSAVQEHKARLASMVALVLKGTLVTLVTMETKDPRDFKVSWH